LGRRILGIDTGGTFTDLVVAEGGRVRVAKVPSTPADPGEAIVAGLERLGGVREGDRIVHGTTVALNALLTGRTARVVLVTGRGFRDLIEIGRGERPDIYALHPEKPAPLVPRSRRFEVGSRVWPDPDGRGFRTVESPDAAELAALRGRVERSRGESVAVCLLHSWARPRIETRVARALRPTGLPITCSGVLVPEHREFERFSTAIVNAALVPLMRRYLAGLERRIGRGHLELLQSSGGTLAAERAALEPVRVLLSGPAGGVVGAARAAREAGLERFVGLDMGGTSTDVAFHGAGAGRTREAGRTFEPLRVAGQPIAVPSLDVHTIGCGGGSLVSVDRGGVLHVGPASAGADPGPVCYGRSDVPTVTDAHVLLGHVGEGAFLGGELALDAARVRRAFAALGTRLGAGPEEAALAVLDVARAAMRRAIGVMTMQRGQDPRGLPIVAFGGAGGLHAAALVELLGAPAALVPRHPGALSALGMTAASATCDRARTVLEPLSAWPTAARRRVQRELADDGAAELVEAGHARRSIRLEHGMDLRYAGQSFELFVPEGKDPADAFHALHERLYGHRLAERPIELVCLRSRAAVPAPPPRPRPVRRTSLPAAARTERRVAVFGSRRAPSPVLDRDLLPPGCAFRGPALVQEYSGTTLVPPGWSARVTAGGHLWLEPARRSR